MTSATMLKSIAASLNCRVASCQAPVRHFNSRLSPEQLMVQKTCRDFGRRELQPVAAQLDRDAVYPEKQIKQLGSLGLMGIGVSPTYSGLGLDTLTLSVVVEELSSHCSSTGVILSIHNCLYANLLDRRGTNRQKEEFLLPFTQGTVGCFALSEPNAGSDVANIQTTARKDGDSWVLNGTKSWVTSAREGKAIIVFATVDKTKKHRGITAFILSLDTPGVSLGPKDDLMGIRALSSCNVTLEEVRVPQEQVLGAVGEGFKMAMAQLDQARIGISSQALGISQAALNCAIDYSLQRKAFGAPLAQISAVQNRLAEISIRLEGARLLVRRAAWECDAGAPYTRHSCTAKVAASKCAALATHSCVQVLGAMGLVRGLPAERLYRDARVTQIYGGATDVQMMVIGQALIKEYTHKDEC